MITTLAAFLAPCLPFLWEKVGAPALESAAGQMGDAAWQKAQAVWSKLSPKIEADPATKAVATELAQNPEDEVWQAAFQKKLQALLESDEDLKQAIAEILNEDEAATTGNRVQITVDKNEGQVIGTMSNSTAKSVGRVEHIQGDVNL